MGIINGIKSCIGAVGDALKGVAEKIKSFLHFSVPDEGPLYDYESWMPDFMKELAKGIEESKKLITSTVQGLATDMVVSPNISASTAAMTIERILLKTISPVLSGKGLVLLKQERVIRWFRFT